MKYVLILLAGLLGSCANLHQASFDKDFADAVIRNKTQAVYSNCNSRNATYPLNGTPPIYYAASYGNEQVIDLLYNQGASLQARSPKGKSLVYAAAANNHLSTADKLIALNAGTPGDKASGTSDYRRQLVADAQARRMQAAALTWLFVAMTSGGGGGSGGSCRNCGTHLTTQNNYANEGICVSCKGAFHAASGGR